MSKERESQPDSASTPISREVIDKTLEDIPLEQRLQADIKIRDLLSSSNEDHIATWLIYYSAAMAGSIHSSDLEEQSVYGDTFLIGALFMLDIKNNQYGESKKRMRRLTKKNLPAYIEGIFPVEFDNERSEEVLDHNKALTKVLKEIKDKDLNQEYVGQIMTAHTEHPEIIDQSFTQQLQRNADEFSSKEKRFAELFYDPAMRTLSEEQQWAFWTGLISTYFLFNTNEELNNLHVLWKKS